MNIEVVGRHALFFDDDVTASFVNSGDALVDWHSLQIDRYDVRHLLDPPPPHRRRSRNPQSIFSEDPALEPQLDHERYLDLPSTPDQPELDEDEKPTNTDGYRSVAFSYGNTDDYADRRNDDAGLESSRFSPSFPVPGSLSQSLPPTEKLHQIIARTAMFVSRHGGQSEIVLRVKQGDNPTFGFLMPDHHLHAYFRYLVGHPELLHFDIDGNSQNEREKAGSEHNDLNRLGGGALSLLGSVYGSGEGDGDDNAETGKEVSGETTNAVDKTISCGSVKTESSADAADKEEAVSKNPLSNKLKVLAVKKNSSIGASKPGRAGGTKKRVDSCSSFIDAEKSKSGSALGVTSKVEPLVLEPPSDLKRLIDKIVELIMKYGKQFEATLLEQDCNKERFIFLLPSNLYHPYYLKVLQKAQESKVNGKGFHFGKDDPVGRGMENKASVLKDGDSSSLGYDTPFEFDRKEKFKMTISKSKKDAQETECRGTQQEFGVTVDAAAAAAILQAATRGIKNPNLGIISGTPPNSNHCHSSEDNKASSPFSLPHGTTEKSDSNGGHNVSVPATKKIAKAAALEAAGEADSSEAHLTKEQKLKTERLKRAKMFVTMLKSGAVPFKIGTSRGSSLEPQESGLSKTACEVNLTGKQREGSSAPVDVDKLVIDEKPERDNFGEEHNERVLRRNYRSRSWEHEDEDENGDENGEEEHNDRYPRRKYRSNSGRHEKDDLYGGATETKHSRKKHHSHSSSLEDGEKSEEDRDHKHSKRKHRSRSSPEDEEDYEDGERDDEDPKWSRKKHRSCHSSLEHSRKRSKRYSREEDDEEERHHRHSGKRHRSHRSSHHSRRSRRRKEKHSSKDTVSRDYTKDDDSSDEHKRASYIERDDELEEGEISSKASDDSRGIASGHVCRETSLDVSNLFQRAPSQPLEGTTEVSDDLRAKIRAMLMATRS